MDDKYEVSRGRGSGCHSKWRKAGRDQRGKEGGSVGRSASCDWPRVGGNS
jgi:hypothetical protein